MASRSYIIDLRYLDFVQIVSEKISPKMKNHKLPFTIFCCDFHRTKYTAQHSLLAIIHEPLKNLESHQNDIDFPF